MAREYLEWVWKAPDPKTIVKPLEEAGAAADKAGDKFSKAKSNLGEAFEHITAKVPGADRLLKAFGMSGEDLADRIGKATSKFPGLGKAAGKLGVDVETAGAGIAAGAGVAAAAIGALAIDGAREFVALAKEAKNLAVTMGDSTESASRWLEVLRPLGVELGDVQDIFGNMAQLIQANDGAFKQLGVSIARNTDGTVDMNETIIRTFEALGKVKDGSERAALAQKLFGEQGSRQMTPLIDKADQLRKMLGGVSDAAVITGEEFQRAAAADADLKQLSATFRDIKLELGQGVLPVAAEFAAQLKQITAGAREVAGPLGGLGPLIADAFHADPASQFRRTVDGVVKDGQAFVEWLTKSKQKQAELTAQTALTTAAVNKNRVEHDELIDTLGSGEAATRNATRAQQEHRDMVLLDADAVALSKRQNEESTKVLDLQAKAQDRAKKAFEDHIGAVRASFDSQAAYREAERKLGEAADEAATAVKAATDAKMKDSSKNIEAGRKMDDLKAQVLDTAAAYGTQNGAVDGSREAYDRQMSKLGELRDEFKDRIPEISAFIDDYIQQLQRAKREAELAAKAVQGFELTAGQLAGGKKGSIDFKASGGPVKANTPYIVGENGPELMVPSSSGVIVPNDALSGATSGSPVSMGGGGGMSVVVNISTLKADAQIGRVITDAIVAAERQYGKGWRA